MNYIFDTCALLSSPNLVEEKLKNKHDVVIVPHTVFLELTHLKKGYLDSARLSREVLRLMADDWLTRDNFSISDKTFHHMPKDEFNGIDNDGVIFELAKMYAINNTENVTLVTGDKDLVIYCKNHNKKGESLVSIEFTGNTSKILDTNFKGYKIIEYGVSDEIDKKITEYYSSVKHNEKQENIFDLCPNEYIEIKGRTSELGRWDSKKNRIVKLKTSDKIQPKNMLQAFAIDMLLNEDSPIKIISGGFGVGKSYLATQYAWDKSVGFSGKKILFVRNPIGADDTADIGFLKGSLDDKLMPYFMPIIDNLEDGMAEFEKKRNQGKLEITIPMHAKGRSLKNTIMVVDEAEDLTIKTFKLLGSRIGENSEIIFSGDVKQTESKYVNNNGLAYFINASKDLEMVSCVILDYDVRSEASKIFADM